MVGSGPFTIWSRKTPKFREIAKVHVVWNSRVEYPFQESMHDRRSVIRLWLRFLASDSMHSGRRDGARIHFISDMLRKHALKNAHATKRQKSQIVKIRKRLSYMLRKHNWKTLTPQKGKNHKLWKYVMRIIFLIFFTCFAIQNLPGVVRKADPWKNAFSGFLHFFHFRAIDQIRA